MTRRATRRPESAPRTFQDFRDAVFRFQVPRLIITALELDLFTAVGSRTWPIPALSRRLRVSPRGLDILCRNLAAVGLLRKEGARYRNSPLGRAELNARSPAYRGAYLRLIRSHWADWSRLTESVRTGKPVPDEGKAPDEEAWRREFSWAMHQRSLTVAPQVAARVDLTGARTLLDLGGGPGTYALAFLARNPSLRATVCDRPPALEVAREIAAGSRHGGRLSYLPLDFQTQKIPGRYDVIWYSNVLHIYSPEENRRLFRRLTGNLEPGGRLVIQDAFLHDAQGLFPLEATLFAATMLLVTEGGNTYSVKETTGWLREAGFRRVRRLRLSEEAGDWEDGLLEATTGLRPGTRARRRRSRGSSPGR